MRNDGLFRLSRSSAAIVRTHLLGSTLHTLRRAPATLDRGLGGKPIASLILWDRAMNTVTAADIAWHMRCYAADLQHEWITPNAILYAWESDLLTVMRNGMVCEIEIKCSRSDLLHDLRKPKHSQGMLMNGSFMEKPAHVGRTHGEAYEEQRRRTGATLCRRPNYFCFAMPCAVYRKLPFGMLPPYAGVYTVDEQGRVYEERRSIQLHTERIAADDLLGLARRVHHRYWEEIRRARHVPGEEGQAAEG